MVVTMKMPSSEMLHRLDLIKIDVSEERRTFIIRVTRIVELVRTLTVTSN
jgi:hypothetical protein